MSAMDSSAPFPKRFRSKHTRSVTGCLTCRRRRKRCDEQTPVCLACEKQRLDCKWPETNVLSKAKHEQDSQTLGVYERPTNLYSFHLPDPFQSDVVKKTNQSGTLLRHYIVHTSVLLSARSDRNDAMRVLVLQLAHYDSLLAHTLVTLGGEHANWDESASGDIKQATVIHKSHTLRGIQDQINVATTSSRSVRYRLALILLLLCFAETMRGAPEIDMYVHLRAVRQLIVIDWQTTSLSKHCHLTGLVLETYAYLALVSYVTPIDPAAQRVIPLDAFIMNVAYLYQFDTFGSHMYLGYDLFEAIPLVCVNAHELSFRDASGELYPAAKVRHRLLKERFQGMLNKSGVPYVDSDNEAALIARQVFCKALLIFLEATALGPEESRPTELINQYVEEYFKSIPLIRASKYGTCMLWPTVIIGSCIVDEEQRQIMSSNLISLPEWQLNQLLLVHKILTLLWAEKDARIFGPYGLAAILDRHKFVLPMA